VVRYAVNASDATEAANRLAAVSQQPFERRSSDHRGEYCLFRAFLNQSEMRVFSNQDPMYRANLDPPEDGFFEVQFGANTLLIEYDGAVDERVDDVIQKAFPDAVRIDQPSC
jgi:hypothetical protein